MAIGKKTSKKARRKIDVHCELPFFLLYFRFLNYQKAIISYETAFVGSIVVGLLRWPCVSAGGIGRFVQWHIGRFGFVHYQPARR
jgi:hypothetical protein